MLILYIYIILNFFQDYFEFASKLNCNCNYCKRVECRKGFYARGIDI